MQPAVDAVSERLGRGIRRRFLERAICFLERVRVEGKTYRTDVFS